MPASAKAHFDGLFGGDRPGPHATVRGRLKPVHGTDFRPWVAREVAMKIFVRWILTFVAAFVATRVRDLAGEYAAANGFDAIFMFETAPLVYVAASSIITDALIRLYDEHYPVN